MISAVLLFAAGIGLLWSGTSTVLRRVPKLAAWLRVSPLVITVLLLAIMTSLPEFCVSLFAALRGQHSAAMGNIVGSNFVTLTFVAGLCALWRPIVVGPTIRERESSWMILSAGLLLVLALDGQLSRGDGLVLLLAYLPYFHRTLMEPNSSAPKPAARRLYRIRGATFLLLGLGMIVLRQLIVVNGTTLAKALVDLLIGVTFTHLAPRCRPGHCARRGDSSPCRWALGGFMPPYYVAVAARWP